LTFISTICHCGIGDRQRLEMEKIQKELIMGRARNIIAINSIAIVAFAGSLYGAAIPPEVKSTKVIVQNNSGGPIVASVEFYPNVKSSDKRIPDYQSEEFNVQYPPLVLHISSAGAKTSHIFYKDFNLFDEYNKKFTPLRTDESMLAIITANPWTYYLEVKRVPQATEKRLLAKIEDPWDAFLGLTQLYQSYTPAEVKRVFMSEKPKPEEQLLQERAARIILELKKNYSKRDFARNYKDLCLKYHPDRAAPESKQMTEEIIKIINNAKDILEQSKYYLSLH
jgi:hypothetical protein